MVEPECDVAGLTTALDAEGGADSAGPDPGFLSIAARLRRGA